MVEREDFAGLMWIWPEIWAGAGTCHRGEMGLIAHSELVNRKRLQRVGFL